MGSDSGPMALRSCKGLRSVVEGLAPLTGPTRESHRVPAGGRSEETQGAGGWLSPNATDPRDRPFFEQTARHGRGGGVHIQSPRQVAFESKSSAAVAFLFIQQFTGLNESPLEKADGIFLL